MSPKGKAERGPASKGGHGGPHPKRALRFLLGALVVLVAGFALLVRTAYVAPSPGRELTLDDLYRLAGENRIKSARFLDEHAVITGTICDAPPREVAAEGQRPPRCYDQIGYRFNVDYPASQVATQQLIDVLRNSTGAKMVVEKQTGVAVARLVATFVFPLLLLATLFAIIFTSTRGDGGLGDVAGFGRLGRRAHRRQKASTGVSFADVAGAEEAVAELREVIDYLGDPARFEAYGAAPPKGVLLFGPPGCGKTLLARATAGETGVPFFSVAGTEFVESLVGVGAARVRDLFRQVREVAPAIVFIDEIDAVGRRRSGEGSSGGEREQTLNQLLVELDGFEVTSGIVLMGATNRPDMLDPALLRPGRFDRHITLEAPDVTGRRAILELHAKHRPLAPDVDFAALARRTPGFTGADLANVVNEAALLTIRGGGGGAISNAQLSEAVMRVLHGPQRRGRLLTADERHRLAVHEVGHAVVGRAFDGGSEMHRISIVARGRGLARSTVDGGERSVLTAGELEERLAAAMAGVAAEVLVLGDASTASADDIERATAIAREMVGVYGLSPSLGRIRLLTSGGDGYLGGDAPSLELVSGATMDGFDGEVRRLMTEAEAAATALLRVNAVLVEEMAAALQEHETLEGPVLDAFLSRVSPAPPAPNGPLAASPGKRRQPKPASSGQ